MGKKLLALFSDKMERQAEINLAKWGERDMLTLLVASTEEMGEVAHEYLGRGCTEMFRIEIIHLAALLYVMYGSNS